MAAEDMKAGRSQSAGSLRHGAPFTVAAMDATPAGEANDIMTHANWDPKIVAFKAKPASQILNFYGDDAAADAADIAASGAWSETIFVARAKKVILAAAASTTDVLILPIYGVA